MRQPTRPRFPIPTPLGLAVVCATAVGCGGGGGGSSSTSSTSAFFQDAAAAVTLTADQQPVFEMHELWLTVEAVRLKDSDDQLVTLEMTTAPLVVDVMTLDTTSVLLGWVNNLVPGVYEGLELRVTAAEMVGLDLQTNQANVSVSLTAQPMVFEAEFKPERVELTPASPTSIVIDWRPAVQAVRDPVTGDVRYELADEVHAFVAGSPGAPGQARPVRDMEARIERIDCSTGTLTVRANKLRMTVQIGNDTTIVDDNRNPITCGDLRVGDEIEIDARLLAANQLYATGIRNESRGDDGSDDDDGTQHDGSRSDEREFEAEGVVEQAQIGNLPRFVLRRRTQPVAEIVTTTATRFKFDDQHAMAGQPVSPAQDIYDGVRLEVEGTVTGTNADGLPVIEADEVELR